MFTLKIELRLIDNIMLALGVHQSITTVCLVNISQHTELPFIFSSDKTHSHQTDVPRNFQIYNIALLTIVAMLYLTFRTDVFYGWKLAPV